MVKRCQDFSLSAQASYKPDFTRERQLLAAGYDWVAGVDEVGRGPLAGPVVAAAVILDQNNLPLGLDDSKRLSAKRRAVLYDEIMKTARCVAIATLSARAIDGSNIRNAALEAMRRALDGLATKPSYVLIDGRDVPDKLLYKAEALIKGDQRSLSIAAASIVAKVLRDRMMACVSRLYPDYGMEKHAGYGTALHRTMIKDKGPIAKLHRFSFAPIKGGQNQDHENS